MQFAVTVYHGDDPEDNVPVYDNQIVYSATRLGSVTVSASDEQEAAAKAWIQIVGRAREEFLKNLNAPAVIIAHETDLGAIAGELRPTAIGMAMYELFNGCEVWYFRVDSIEWTNRMELCVETCRQVSDSHPNTQGVSLSEILIPSRN